MTVLHIQLNRICGFKYMLGDGGSSNSTNYIPTIYCITHLDEFEWFIIRFFKTLLPLARVNIWPEKVGSEYVYDAKSRSTEEIIQEIVPLFLRVIFFLPCCINPSGARDSPAWCVCIGFEGPSNQARLCNPTVTSAPPYLPVVSAGIIPDPISIETPPLAPRFVFNKSTLVFLWPSEWEFII